MGSKHPASERWTMAHDVIAGRGKGRQKRSEPKCLFEICCVHLLVLLFFPSQPSVRVTLFCGSGGNQRFRVFSFFLIFFIKYIFVEQNNGLAQLIG